MSVNCNRQGKGVESASKIRFLTANVRGWGDIIKAGKQMVHYKTFDPSIICVSETKFDKRKEKQFRNSYSSEYRCFFNSYASNARGVAVLISKKQPVKILGRAEDDQGRYLVIFVEINGKTLAIASVYAPNEDCPDFFEDLFEVVYNFNPEHAFITGDFNTGPSELLDYCNYNTVVHRNARSKLSELFESYEMSDTYRVKHNDRIEYTWIADGIRPQKSRIDLTIISNNLIPFIKESKIVGAFLSDHNFLINDLDFLQIQRGKGFWRLDNEFLNDPEYIRRVTKAISITLSKYVKYGNYNILLEEGTADEVNDFCNLDPQLQQGYEYSIDPNLLLEMLINDIKNESISYITAAKKEKTSRLNFVKRMIENYRKKNVLNQNEQNLYNDYVTEYDVMIENTARKIMKRDKILSKAFNEKPSKFFCNLEKDKSAEKFIPKLKCKDNTGNSIVITNQAEIENEVTKFYKNLYSNKDYLLNDISLHEFLETCPNEYYPSIDVYDNNYMSKEISMEEMEAILKDAKNGSAPGQTGLTYEFYKKFWNRLGHFLTKAANYSYETGALPNCLSRGTISLLPKEDKDKTLLANWRPLTLLSVEYKLISGCIAKRLGTLLPKIIHPDQNGFVGGRYIGESVRLVFDAMHHAKVNKVKGLLLLVDFEKAFDSVSHNFILKCLDFFGFNTESKNWIKILLQNFYVNTVHAGNISECFLLNRGSKQGDPVSSLIFIICVELLSMKISKKLSGIKIGNIHVKRTLYADDLTIFLEYDPAQLKDAVNLLKEFYTLSGLKINTSKTQVVMIGDIPNDNYVLCNELGLKWAQEFRLLGVDFDAKLLDMNVNYDKAVEKIVKIINNWRFRFITVYGKLTIAKSLLLSKLAHLNLVLPNLSNDKIDEIEEVILRFIWRTKENTEGKDKVARQVCKLPEIKGGMNFPNLRLSMSSSKLSWLRRGFFNQNATWVGVLNAELNIYKEGLTLNDILTSMSIEDICKIKIANPFWESCFRALKTPYLAFLRKYPNLIVDKVIWGSKLVDETDRTMNRHNNRAIASEIVTICDALENVNNVLVFKSEADLTRGVEYDPAKLANFRLTLSRYLLNYGIRIGQLSFDNIITRPRIPLILRIVTLEKKGCSAWNDLVKGGYSAQGVTAQEVKWENKLNMRLGVNYWNSCYSFLKLLNYNNKQKWLHYQILRKCLMVNYVVAKFKPEVNENCTFCNNEPETIQHLFYYCNVSRRFINASLIWLRSHGLNIDMQSIDVYDFLFLQRVRNRTFECFFSLLSIKYFIWLSRCNKKNPCIDDFKDWHSKELDLIMHNIEHYPRLGFVVRMLDSINNPNSP